MNESEWPRNRGRNSVDDPGAEFVAPASDASHARVRFTAHSETAKIDCLIDENGKLKAVSMPRWGNPEGTAFHCVNFGGFAEKEQTFGGYTIPTQLRVGWHFGSDKFESDGEFFRVNIDDATYR